MTKTELAKQIIQTVDNSSDDNAIENVKALLDILVPKDLKQFSKWGYPFQQTTEDKCWE